MWQAIPLGALWVTACAVLAVSPIRRPRPLATASWLAGMFPNELPFVFGLLVVGPTILSVTDGDLSDRDTVAVALTGVTVVALAVVVARAVQTRAVVERSLDEALGDDWRPGGDVRQRRHRPWFRILFAPWPMRPRSVVRSANVAYGDRGVDHLLDVYRHRSLPADAPTLIHLHGGHFRWGRKSREARALLFRLAGQGWTCISANYHLSRTPIDGFPTHLVDVKRLLAWARSDGREHGVDPTTIVLTGSSAGAHLTSMAALTANDPVFQPGFEEADTSIAAGIGLGGYYGGLDGNDTSPSSPLAHEGTVPPFFVVHGECDTTSSPEGARLIVEHIRSQPGAVVGYAELPGGQHAFDLFGSIRFEAVVDGIETFTDYVRADRVTGGPRPEP